MAASFLKKFGRLLQSRQKRKSSGFTLIELLVVIIIAGGIISGLMYLVVELLGVDQRESSRTETQREMQLAMDYIASELREAVYVYNGECFAGRSTATPPTDCPRLINYLPDNLRNSNNIPVLAFWKQQSVPEPVKARCRTDADAAIGRGDPCTSASSYALIVYYISREPNPIWAGNARIKRYALTEFQADGTSNNVFATPPGQGYVRPDEVSVKFDTWPFGTNPTTNLVGNLQNRPPADTSAILVDFLDSRLPGVNGLPAATATPACPTGYSISPANSAFGAVGAPQIRSFYACIDTGATSGRNRDVILYIRGNAQGRPGIRGANTFVPTLETRVLVRGVLGRNP